MPKGDTPSSSSARRAATDSDSSPCCYSKPLTLHLFFAGTQAELEASHELVMDIPGGGFICMNPMHHEERLLRWAIQTKKVVISFDYGKVSSRRPRVPP